MTLQLPDLEDDAPARLDIGGRPVDARSAPLVIAEAGVNHDGKLERALALVDAAAEAGADAVKFQLFRAAELAVREAESAAYQQAAGAGPTQRHMLEQLELPPDAFRRVAGHCRERGVQFLATPFGPEELRELCNLGVPAVKIASTDLDNRPLLEAAARTGRPILLSTGASMLEEIDEALDWLEQLDAGDRVLLMHCVSSYPTPAAEASLATIARLHARCRCWVGFSDHTMEIDTGGLAVACGARVLEKHFTLDRGARGPDHAMSLEPGDFHEYVQGACRAWQMLGKPRCGVAGVEQDVRRLGRRSIVARSAIRRGERLTEANLALKRPAGGLSPARWHEVLGRRAACDIAADTQFSWEMVS